MKPENIDIARVAMDAYQSYDDKPARIEVLRYNDGSEMDLFYGQINPCEYGDQCEGHACYCNNPDAYRKCHCSWFYGEKDLDGECRFYSPNPYWQDGSGDFYEQRNKTVLHMKALGLVKIDIIEIDNEPPEWYKGKKSKFI